MGSISRCIEMLHGIFASSSSMKLLVNDCLCHGVGSSCAVNIKYEKFWWYTWRSRQSCLVVYKDWAVAEQRISVVLFFLCGDKIFRSNRLLRCLISFVNISLLVLVVEQYSYIHCRQYQGCLFQYLANVVFIFV